MPEPVQLLASAVSRWGEDEWSRGAWSLIGVDGTPADRTTVGSPVGTRLRIAGEGTHPTRAGMTHGAHEQGVQAGEWAAALGHRRVVVVGAGIAGLAAAQELRGHGVDVQVWEARDRVGGRAVGVEVGGSTFDLGANWLQQFDENVLARTAEALGLRTVATDFTDPLVLGSPTGGVPRPEGLARGLRERLATAAPGTSIGQVVEEWLRDPRPWTAEVVRRFVDAEVVMDTGVPLSSLSARHGFEAGVGEGDRWIVGSYRRLLDHLAEGVDVRLRRPVRRVEVRDDGVLVTGADEGVHDGEVRSDAVIVTVPFAVLAAGAVEFVPPLPGGHRDALARLPTGRVEKVVLRLDRRFWPEHAAGYYRVHGPGAGSVSEWLDATEADRRPTLVGLFAGPWVEELWAGEDDDVARAALGVVTAALGP